MRLEINGRFIRLENTVITEDDESRAVWANYCEAKKHGEDEFLMRPGKYDPPNAKGPSPYYNARRIYPKVYDKLALDFDPSRSQCADDEPNVILLSFSGPGVFPDDPGYSWALDFLFNPWFDSDHQKEKAAGVPDVSLKGWLDHHATDICNKKLLTTEQYAKSFDDLLNAPRKLGGIMLFKNCSLMSARINYHAYEQCSLSHAKMAELEELFSLPPGYAL